MTFAALAIRCAFAMLVVCCMRPAHAEPQPPPPRISRITMAGPVKTQEKIVRMFLALDTGSVYDSVAVDDARTRLLKTGLFSKVDILRLHATDGVRLYIVLREHPRFTLSDIGGELYNRRYGLKDSFWRLWSAHLGARLNNIGGRMESLRFDVEFWEWRSIGISWNKPLFPGPYNVYFGFSAADFPFQYEPWRHFLFQARTGAGRTIGEKARVGAGVRLIYNTLTYHGPATPGTLNVAYLPDSGAAAPAACAVSGFPMTDDTSWTDTCSWNGDSIAVRRWTGNRLYETNRSQRRFLEIFTALSYTLDHTAYGYPTEKGWLASAQLGCNVPFTDTADANLFFQFNTECRFYHPFFWKNNSMVYRLKTVLRDRDGGRFHRVVAGGSSSLRGYGSGGIGLYNGSNNSVLLTGEYRFPIVSLPPIPVPAIASFYTPYTEITYRFDGALYCDYGLLWHDLTHPMTDPEIGMSLGAGIRLVVQELQRAICFDLTPVRMNPYTYDMEPTFRWEDRVTGETKWSVPAWDLYIDFSF